MKASSLTKKILHATCNKIDLDQTRLVINEDFLFEDCLAYYKRNDFDPTKPIRFVFENQPGIDAGGLFRQFYDSLFDQLTSDTFSHYRLFTLNFQCVQQKHVCQKSS